MRIMLGIATALVLLCSPAAGLSSDHIGTAVSRAQARMLEWLEAFNSQDESRYGPFVRENAPALEKFIGDDYRFAVYLGGYRLRRILSATDALAEAELVDPFTDTVTQLTVKVTAQAPYPILAADVAPTKEVTDGIAQFPTDAQLAAQLDQRIDAQSSDQRFSGVVLVMHAGKTVFERGYGDFASLPDACHARDVPFASASLGKMLTATAVLQLSRAGRVRLDAPISTYLPGMTTPALGKATVRQLLDHTAGAGDFMEEPALRAKPDDYRSLKAIVDLLHDREPTSPPGAQWSYSNYGYVLLGRLVEVVSGQDYSAYIQAHALPGPAATVDPSCLRIARLHTRGPDGKGWIDRPPGLEELPTSAGGAALSAAQLASFGTRFLQHDLLDGNDAKLMMTGAAPIPNGR